MKNGQKIVARQVSIDKLLEEVSKNTRKLKACDAMDIVYTAILKNEENNELFKELQGNPKYEQVIGQIVFTTAMLLTSFTLPQREAEKVVARCEKVEERLN